MSYPTARAQPPLFRRIQSLFPAPGAKAKGYPILYFFEIKNHNNVAGSTPPAENDHPFTFLFPNPHLVFVQNGKSGNVLPDADQFLIKIEKNAVMALVTQVVVKFSLQKRFFILGVGGITLPLEGGKFFTTSLPDIFDQRSIRMA